MRAARLIGLGILLSGMVPARAQTAGDTAAIRTAALDYEGVDFESMVSRLPSASRSGSPSLPSGPTR